MTAPIKCEVMTPKVARERIPCRQLSGLSVVDAAKSFFPLEKIQKHLKIDLRVTSVKENVRSSSAAEQFHSDANLEAVVRRAPNNSKNRQWTTEGDVSTRRSTPAPHGSE
ncbi:hypothetical protein TNCV_407611 [Trichonephila clavipes]|nr:hypothetical protein TNCV_407611 [Trichonephila clavipes]